MRLKVSFKGLSWSLLSWLWLSCRDAHSYHVDQEAAVQQGTAFIQKESAATIKQKPEATMKGIVLDLDYTLVYPTVEFEEVFQKFFNTPLDTVSKKWLDAIYNNPKAQGQEIIEYTFPDLSPSEAQEKAVAFALEWAKVHNIYPGCLEFLTALKANSEYKIGLLTNGPSDFQRAIVDFLGLSEYFDVIVASGDEDLGIRKPNAEIFSIMAQKMGLPPSSLFMVGDALEKEIRPAVELGWGGIWIKPLATAKIGNRISLQSLLESSHSIPDSPLSVNWGDID